MQIATLKPMLAQLVRELPEGGGRDGGGVELRSRHGLRDAAGEGHVPPPPRLSPGFA